MISSLIPLILLPITYYSITRKTKFQTPPEFDKIEKEINEWLSNTFPSNLRFRPSEESYLEDRERARHVAIRIPPTLKKLIDKYIDSNPDYVNIGDFARIAFQEKIRNDAPLLARAPHSMLDGGSETARKYRSTTCGKRYLGNTVKKEVHDLDNEQTGANRCQIDEIIAAGHSRTFTPDKLEQAHSEGYDNCAHCIGARR